MAWRVGKRVPINVYKDDAPVCQCQTPELAAEIVLGMNVFNKQIVLQQALGDQTRIDHIESAAHQGTIKFGVSPEDRRGEYYVEFVVGEAHGLSHGMTLREAMDKMWGLVASATAALAKHPEVKP